MGLTGMKWFVGILTIGIVVYLLAGGVEWEVVYDSIEYLTIDVLPDTVQEVVVSIIQ